MNVKSATFLRLYEDNSNANLPCRHVVCVWWLRKGVSGKLCHFDVSPFFLVFFARLKNFFYRNHHSDGLCILVSITMVCQYYLESSSIFIKGFISF
jgi:hypothetical protein